MKRVFLSISIIVLFTTFAVGQTESVNKKFDTPVKIISKPKAAYPSQENGTICVQGTVTLRIQFLGTGEIGKISVVSGLPYGITENAIEAAKKIKFIPSLKDGKPVTVFRQVQYNFSIY